MGALYQITFENGKSYIGITSTSVKRRMVLHRSHAREDRNCALHRAIRKYGEDSFAVKTLVIADDWSYLCDLEKKAIAKFGTIVPQGYNITHGGEGALGTKRTPEQIERMRQRRLSDETKAKISKACLGYRHTDEAKKKIAEAGRGRIFSESRKAKIGATKVGNKYCLGIPCSDEKKRKISEAQKGRTFSDEHRKHLSESHKGKPWTEKQRAAVRRK